MIPYIILIGIPCFISLVLKEYPTKKKEKNLIISVFFFLFLFLLAARGLNIGNDTYSYKVHYEAAKNISWEKTFDIDAEWEYGYAILQKLLSDLSVGFRWFLLLVSAFAVFPIWKFYKKESAIPLLTIALFITVAPFYMYFSGLRQIMAMAFAIPAFYFTKNKKPMLFLLMVALAFMFHKSAFILLLMYPICRINITKYRVWIAVPIIGIVWVFNEQIFLFLVKFISDLYVGEIKKTGAYTVLVLLVLFAVYSYLIPTEGELDEDTKALRNLLLLSVCLQCFAFINPLAMRLNYYYLIFIPILVPKIVIKSKASLRQIAEVSVLGMSVFFIVYFYYNLLNGGTLNIYPYTPFWS